MSHFLFLFHVVRKYSAFIISYASQPPPPPPHTHPHPKPDVLELGAYPYLYVSEGTFSMLASTYHSSKKKIVPVASPE